MGAERILAEFRRGPVRAGEIETLESLQEIPQRTDLLAREPAAPGSIPAIVHALALVGRSEMTPDHLATLDAEEFADRVVEGLVHGIVLAIAHHDRLAGHPPADPRTSRGRPQPLDESRLAESIETFLHHRETHPRTSRELVGIERLTASPQEFPERERIDVAEHVGKAGFTEVECVAGIGQARVADRGRLGGPGARHGSAGPPRIPRRLARSRRERMPSLA